MKNLCQVNDDSSVLSTAVHPGLQNRKRRWTRISLRTCLLLVTCACVWLAVVDHRARQQKVGVEWLNTFYGRYWISDYTGLTSELRQIVIFHYDFQLDELGDINEDESLPGPRWVCDAIGLDYLANIESVNINEPEPPLDDIAKLANFFEAKSRQYYFSS